MTITNVLIILFIILYVSNFTFLYFVVKDLKKHKGIIASCTRQLDLQFILMKTDDTRITKLEKTVVDNK